MGFATLRHNTSLHPVGKIGHAWQNTRLFAPTHAEEKIPKADFYEKLQKFV